MEWNAYSSLGAARSNRIRDSGVGIELWSSIFGLVVVLDADTVYATTS